MRFYVAAKTHDLRRARMAMQILRAHDHLVTHDWTGPVEERLMRERLGEDSFIVEAEETEAKRKMAIDDARGVTMSQCVVALAHPRVCGTLVEIGIAIGAGIPVWLVGMFPHSVFWELPEPVVTKFANFELFAERVHNDYIAQKTAPARSLLSTPIEDVE